MAVVDAFEIVKVEQEESVPVLVETRPRRRLTKRGEHRASVWQIRQRVLRCLEPQVPYLELEGEFASMFLPLLIQPPKDEQDSAGDQQHREKNDLFKGQLRSGVVSRCAKAKRSY